MDDRSRRAVEVAEQYADMLLPDEELRQAHEMAGCASDAAHWENRPGPVQTAAEAAVAVAANADLWQVLPFVLNASAEALADEGTDNAWETTWQSPGRTNQERWDTEQAIYQAAEAKERAWQAALLHCVFQPATGHDFEPAARVLVVQELAQQIYSERVFERLPELGDALEAAGCTDAAILAHCRSGPHARGCFVLDLILGKG